MFSAPLERETGKKTFAGDIPDPGRGYFGKLSTDFVSLYLPTASTEQAAFYTIYLKLRPIVPEGLDRFNRLGMPSHSVFLYRSRSTDA